jgi:hypothetical protein
LEYDVGQFIEDHSDIGSNIRASCTLNLNEDYEGGDFRFFMPASRFQNFMKVPVSGTL